MESILLFMQVFLSANSCNASVFGYVGDKYQTDEVVCGHRQIKKGELGVAHRTLKCGTKIVLFNPRTKKTAVARVIDRGPYGARDGTKWVLKRTGKDLGTWRGCLDLTEALKSALDHNGFEKVIYWKSI